MQQDLNGKVAVITGGTGALGRAVVKTLAKEGMRLTVPWVLEQEEASMAEYLGDLGERVHLQQADLTDPAQVEALIGGTVERMGRLDGLCNLAGGFVWSPLEGTEPDTWQRMLAMNATTVFTCCRAAEPHLKKSGAGRVVNVAAVPALDRGAANMSAYSASKAAVLNLTQSLAQEWVGQVGVNAIVPTIIDTPTNRRDMPDADTSTWLQPEDMAKVIGWLLSEDSALVTGAALTLNNG